jgi:hypothetical protein
MANKKFSQFDLKTNSADVQFVVGYNGTDNVRIAPSNLGGGATSLNGLSDCLVDTASLYVGEVPSSLSGNPQNNTSLGIDASRDLTTATQTTSIGNNAGKQATTGLGNTNLGYQAGSQNQTGIFNTNIGNGSGFWNTASYNVFVGYDSGQITGGYNTGVGVSALGKALSSSCIYSVAVGYRAGHQQTAANVVLIGFDAGRANTATGNVSIGSQAGYSQTSGTGNTNVGYQAGYSNTTSADRTIIGYEAGEFNTGAANTFLGLGAGKGASGSSTGSYNTSIGKEAGLAITSGGQNVMMGASAGAAITTGFRNVTLGYEAGLAITTAYDNILIGSQSGKSLTTSPNSSTNVCIGTQAGFSANNANGNVLIGHQAGYGLTNGETNVIIGQFASAYSGALTTGDNNTIIGFNSYPSSATVNNEITLGNSSISTLRCAVTSITSLSDERDKSEIKDLGYGLAFIDALQPREFVWDNRPEIDKDGEEIYSANKGKKDFGFIAQEVQELDNDTLRLVYDSNPDKLELSYGKLVPILVQAIKELKAEVELLKS